MTIGELLDSQKLDSVYEQLEYVQELYERENQK